MGNKPSVKLENLSGNIYAVLGAASNALRKMGQREKINELRSRVTAAGDYDKALCVIMEYVDFDGDNDEDERNKDDEAYNYIEDNEET